VNPCRHLVRRAVRHAIRHVTHPAVALTAAAACVAGPAALVVLLPSPVAPPPADLWTLPPSETDPVPVAEPSSAAVMAVGVLGVVVGRRVRRPHDLSPISGHCVECALPIQFADTDCCPSTDDSPEAIAEIERIARD
jgi:hypothetical protein